MLIPNVFQIKKSLIPFAGKGVFAAKNFKEGDLVAISPTVVLPKFDVANIGSDRRTIIQNYCIAHPDVAHVVLFPFGLGSMANHAVPMKANMKLEWHWWNEEEKERKMSSTAYELGDSPFVQLDIAYKATRDISDGEELTYDYGNDWAEAWTDHLANLNQWYCETYVTLCPEACCLFSTPRHSIYSSFLLHHSFPSLHHSFTSPLHPPPPYSSLNSIHLPSTLLSASRPFSFLLVPSRPFSPLLSPSLPFSSLLSASLPFSSLLSASSRYLESAIRDAAENDHIPPDQLVEGAERPRVS